MTVEDKHDQIPLKIFSPLKLETKMHLMYTLDADGNRVYTLKVRLSDPFFLLRTNWSSLENN